MNTHVNRATMRLAAQDRTQFAVFRLPVRPGPDGLVMKSYRPATR